MCQASILADYAEENLTPHPPVIHILMFSNQGIFNHVHLVVGILVCFHPLQILQHLVKHVMANRQGYELPLEVLALQAVIRTGLAESQGLSAMPSNA